MVKVLFVCLGNICRSPTAQGVFEHMVAENGLAERIRVDSAGTSAWHVGDPPDRRAQRAARRRGIDLSRQRSRQTSGLDYEQFDYILAMDQSNLQALRRTCPDKYRHKLRLFLEFAPHLGRTDVPDPYYGGPNGFEDVLDLITAASAGLLAHIQENNLR